MKKEFLEPMFECASFTENVILEASNLGDNNTGFGDESEWQ